MAIGAKDQAKRLVEPAAVGHDEGVDEGPRRTVVAQDLVGLGATDVQVAVRAEDQTLRRIQPAVGGGDEGVDEGPRRPPSSPTRLTMFSQR